jgi:hypothetical protein
VKVANRKEAVVGVPVIVEPVEVQVPLRVVLVKVRNVAVIIDLTNGALYEKPSTTPSPENIQGLNRICDLSQI